MKPQWTQARKFEDIRYEKWQGIAKITINRPQVRNAFRPQTLFEMSWAFNDAREDSTVGVVILTGEGKEAFCSGGDQRIRGDQGYVGQDGVPRLNVARFLRLGFEAGCYARAGTLLHVNRGLGTSGQRVRVGVPREISVLTLTAACRRGRARSRGAACRRRSHTFASST